MSFGTRLKKRREELGLKQAELGQMLGITGSAIGNYENDISSPKAEILYQVFDVLKCDANYLFQDEMKKLEVEDFSVNEKNMVKKYRTLDKYGKEMVLGVLKFEFKRCREQEKNEITAPLSVDIIYLQEPIQTASAGFGQLADDETSETIAVIRNQYTSKADYIMRVSGDSMEPKFFDGQEVLVREQPAVEPGEIGIFIIGGERFIKTYRGDYLESANPNYPNVKFDEYSKCIGKVLGVLESDWIVEE